MKVKNTSNYPKTVNGVRIEPGETEEVSLDEDRLQHFRDDGNLELEEDDSETSESVEDEEEEESEDDNEETSKPAKNKEEGDD